MSIKDELKQYRFKVLQVDRTLEEYQMFKTRAEKMTSIISEVSAHTNKVSNKVGDNAVIMADLEVKYKTAWQEAELERLALTDKIKNVDEPYRTILFMRYVQGKTFENIADAIGYSYKQILRLHGQALNLFDIASR